MTGITVEAIPAFSDNYIWLISTGGKNCAVVDPGDPRPVLERISREGLALQHVLITHHHPDHIGGLAALSAAFSPTVWGPADSRIPGIDQVISEGDPVHLDGLDLDFEVVDVPGHTLSHIAYHGHGALFCGDTLFSVGCGRLFEGSPEQMQTSLDKLARLPGELAVYCAHEYTESNCQFALEVEPGNPELVKRAIEVREARIKGQRTVPSLLSEECAVNPFMRTREHSVVEAARNHNPAATAGASTLAEIRAWKDRY